MLKKSFTFVIGGVLLLATGSARAASIPDTCQAAKNKETGKLAKCLQYAEKKLVSTGDMAAYTAGVTACTTKFTDKFNSAEQKAIDKGGTCQTTGDETAIRNAVSANSTCIASALEAGDLACLLCGNGVLDAGEDCDLGTVGGATCSTATGGTLDVGTLACGAGCAFNTSGCSVCPGSLVGGFCWFLGTAGNSCTTTCVAQGLSYSSATLSYAGSDGSDANCNAVLTALGVPLVGLSMAGPGNMGCHFYVGSRFRDAVATTGNASFTGAQRACACQ